MKTIFISYYHQFTQMAISLVLIIIVLAIPSASLADVTVYKALFTGYFKNAFYHNHL